jgi:hypothetical protein
MGMAAPILDGNSVGEPVYFAFAHDCQVEAADLQPADEGQTIEDEEPPANDSPSAMIDDVTVIIERQGSQIKFSNTLN